MNDNLNCRSGGRFTSVTTSIYSPGKIIFILLGSMILITAIVYFFLPKEIDLTIQSFSWERKIDIERFQTVEESAWSLPDGARLLRKQRKFHSTQRYVSGYSNGKTTYNLRPIYKTKYYYEIDKWLYERTVSTSGNDKDPYWGETNLNSDERIGTETEHYIVIGIDKNGKTHEINLSYDDWGSLNIGQTTKFKVSFGNGEIIE